MASSPTSPAPYLYMWAPSPSQHSEYKLQQAPKMYPTSALPSSPWPTTAPPHPLHLRLPVSSPQQQRLLLGSLLRLLLLPLQPQRSRHQIVSSLGILSQIVAHMRLCRMLALLSRLPCQLHRRVATIASHVSCNEILSQILLHRGSVSIVGQRREMEDAVTIKPMIGSTVTSAYDFFGVYNGHGGEHVAAACRERLHVVLADVVGGDWPEGGRAEERWRSVMAECFAKVDEEVAVAGERADASDKTVGSTAVVAVVAATQIVVANCGDSRVVLSRGGVAVLLSTSSISSSIPTPPPPKKP